jgi:AAA+ superfamily predicted ATPase
MKNQKRIRRQDIRERLMKEALDRKIEDARERWKKEEKEKEKNGKKSLS